MKARFILSLTAPLLAAIALPARWLRRYALVGMGALFALLVACGGGGGGGTTTSDIGSGGSGVAEGSITGFGSVIVDGVTYDDTNASIRQESSDGVTQLVQPKLGQRVRVMHQQSGVADQILVLPQLRGTVSQDADSSGWFKLLGQWVQIVTASDTQNTATVMSGLSTVNSGDSVEVHGTWAFDSTKGTVLVATRIERLGAAPNPVLISGMVAARNDNQTLTLESGAMLRTSNSSNLPASIGAKSLVTAWVPLDKTSQSPWMATRVIDAKPQIATNQRMVITVRISERDVQQGSVTAQGLTIKLTPELMQDVRAVGDFVQLEIVPDGSGWRAISVKSRRSGDDLGSAVKLKGALIWPDSPVGTLTLRGVTVNVGSQALGSSCQRVGAGDNVYVEIIASRPTTNGGVLSATQVSCSTQSPSTAVIEVSGRLKQVNAVGSGTTGSIVVTTRLGDQTFQWTELTFIPGGWSSLNGLIGRSVEVEYQVINGERRMRLVKPD